MPLKTQAKLAAYLIVAIGIPSSLLSMDKIDFLEKKEVKETIDEDALRETLETYISSQHQDDLSKAQKLILQYPCIINKQHRGHQTPLHSAICYYLIECAKPKKTFKNPLQLQKFIEKSGDQAPMLLNLIKQSTLNANNTKAYAQFIQFLLDHKEINPCAKNGNKKTPIELFDDNLGFDWSMQNIDLYELDQAHDYVVLRLITRLAQYEIDQLSDKTSNSYKSSCDAFSALKAERVNDGTAYALIGLITQTKSTEEVIYNANKQFPKACVDTPLLNALYSAYNLGKEHRMRSLTSMIIYRIEHARSRLAH